MNPQQHDPTRPVPVDPHPCLGALPVEVYREGPSGDVAPIKPWHLQKRSSGRPALVLAWCGWLLGSWFIVLFGGGDLVPTRAMPLAALVGITLLWPAYRLGQRRPFPNGRVLGLHTHVVLDWMCLLIVFQSVLWPVRAIAGWGMAQAVWLDAAVAAWGLLAAWIISMGCRSPFGGHRMVAMAACVLVLLGEPALMGLINLGAAHGDGLAWTMWLSPLEAVWAMTAPPSAWTPQPWSIRVMVIGLISLLGWVWVGLRIAGSSDRHR